MSINKKIDTMEARIETLTNSMKLLSVVFELIEAGKMDEAREICLEQLKIIEDNISTPKPQPQSMISIYEEIIKNEEGKNK